MKQNLKIITPDDLIRRIGRRDNDQLVENSSEDTLNENNERKIEINNITNVSAIIKPSTNTANIQKEIRDLELKNGIRIKATDKFKYLGFPITNGDKTKEEVTPGQTQILIYQLNS